MILQKYKKTKDPAVAKVLEKEKKLKTDADDYRQLDELFAHVNGYCKNWGQHLCGMKKFTFRGDVPLYIAFVLDCEFPAGYRKTSDMDIRGYIFDGLAAREIYRASIRHHLGADANPPVSRLVLVDNRILDSKYGDIGIGSAGLSVVKEIAYQLHCTKIYGTMCPISEECLEPLRQFYQRNGFKIDEKTRELVFDME